MFIVKLNKKVFGPVFGPGEITSVWEDSYFSFEVTYKTGDVIAYTAEGIPSWNTDLEERTVYSKEEIDIFDLDMAPSNGKLSAKKIIKLKMKGDLEIKCPSGIWRQADECPQNIVLFYMKDGLYHLFRKAE